MTAPEAPASKRWYQKWWVWALIAFSLVVIANLSGAGDETDEASGTTTTEVEATTTRLAEGTTTTEATTTTATLPENPGSLDMTPDEFRDAWNGIVSETEVSELSMPPLEVQDGEVQDVAQVFLTERIALNISVNKADGTIRDILMLTEPTSDALDNATAILAWGVMFRSTTVPPSGPDHASDCFEALGLIDSDLENIDSEAVVGGVRYTAQFFPELGLFMVSAGDPQE